MTTPTLIDAAKQALEALEVFVYRFPESTLAKGSVQAIRSAIKDAEQQEPVVRFVCKGCEHEYITPPTSCDCMESTEYERIEYYTQPPAAKEWQWLTRQEISKASAVAQVDFCLDKQPTYECALASAIEAKLKEKNSE